MTITTNKFFTDLNRALALLIVITILAFPALACVAAGVLVTVWCATLTLVVGVLSGVLSLSLAYPQALACAAVLFLPLISERRAWA